MGNIGLLASTIAVRYSNLMKKSDARRSQVDALIELYKFHLTKGIKIVGFFILAAGAAFSFYILHPKNVFLDSFRIFFVSVTLAFACYANIGIRQAEAVYSMVVKEKYLDEPLLGPLMGLLAEYKVLLICLELLCWLTALGAMVLDFSGLLEKIMLVMYAIYAFMKMWQLVRYAKPS